MRLRIAKLRDRLLTLVFVLAWLAIFAALFVEGGVLYFGPGAQIFSISLLAGALLAFLVVGWRWIRFRKQAHGLLRHLVTGDYEAGVRVSKHWRDEITELEELFNKLTEQLRQYDELRTKRIRQLRMTLDLILEHTQEPMGLFEVDKAVLTFNAAMSGVLDTSRQTVPLSTLENLEPNKSFVELLIRAIQEEKSAQEGRVHIQFPGRDSLTETEVRIVPFKDKDETVPLAVIFAKRA
jgi:nitrogen fixation/metabolism regulation signal transduction histidine kinase